jgi:Transposase IS66 family
MAPDLPDSLERLSYSDLIGAMRDLVGEFTRLREKHEELIGAMAKLRIEHQAIKDELARYKKLPPRPPQKPSGMEKATDLPDAAAGRTKGEHSKRRRGSNLEKLKINQTVVVPVAAPAGSRRKGYEEIVVQDLVLNPSATLYRRERWETPDGQTLIAPLEPGIVGGYGPHLHRLVLMLHFQGQMTCERILALLNAAGVVISKRQVVRLLVAKLETFRAEDEEVLTAGLSGSRFVTVDDTGARHQGKPGFTTHIGSDRFAVFRTGPSKSRLAFLRNLLGGAARYVLNEAALVYMRDNHLPQAALDKLANCATPIFPSDQDWMRRLSELGLTDLTVTPDPVRVASEGALWGALQEEGRLGELVIVSDGACQFRVGVHAQCWIHAERLVHKLTPANQIQHQAVEVARRMIWWFYGRLKEYKLAPSPQRAESLRAQFRRIFDRAKTGYAALDSLLRRLLRLEDRLMRVLERPEIPLHTNASENDIRGFVTKRKISGGTVSEKGRQARDVMLGLAKTCKKLKISFFDYLGARLGIKGPQIPSLATLVREAPS